MGCNPSRDHQCASIDYRSCINYRVYAFIHREPSCSLEEFGKASVKCKFVGQTFSSFQLFYSIHQTWIVFDCSNLTEVFWYTVLSLLSARAFMSPLKTWKGLSHKFTLHRCLSKLLQRTAGFSVNKCIDDVLMFYYCKYVLNSAFGLLCAI